jgi:hypothetical protein
MHFALERLIMAINGHARAEYALEHNHWLHGAKRGFGTTIDKFQALRHNSGTCNRSWTLQGV